MASSGANGVSGGCITDVGWSLESNGAPIFVPLDVFRESATYLAFVFTQIGDICSMYLKILACIMVQVYANINAKL